MHDMNLLITFWEATSNFIVTGEKCNCFSIRVFFFESFPLYADFPFLVFLRAHKEAQQNICQYLCKAFHFQEFKYSFLCVFIFFLVLRFLGFCALVWLWQSKLFAFVITKQEEWSEKPQSLLPFAAREPMLAETS